MRYKGEASYWSLEAPTRSLEDLVWTYERPLGDTADVAGRLSFFDERVDVVLDGVRRGRPDTEFTRLGWREGTRRSPS